MLAAEAMTCTRPLCTSSLPYNPTATAPQHSTAKKPRTHLSGVMLRLRRGLRSQQRVSKYTSSTNSVRISHAAGTEAYRPSACNHSQNVSQFLTRDMGAPPCSVACHHK